MVPGLLQSEAHWIGVQFYHLLDLMPVDLIGLRLGSHEATQTQSTLPLSAVTLCLWVYSFILEMKQE